MTRRAWQIVAAVALAVILLVAGGVAVLHLPAMRSRIFDYAVQQLRTRYQIDLQADRLDYNLLARRITLSGVRLAAQGHEDDPFLTAQRMQVVLPWTIFRGVFAFEQIDVSNAAVAMRRYADGSSNLPAGGGTQPDPNRPPLKLNIRGLAIDSLDFSFRDDARQLAVEAGGLGLDLDWGVANALEGIMGPIEIRRGVRIQAGERQIVAQPVTGFLAFDGSNITLENIQLQTAEATLVTNGRVERALDQPAFDLRFSGDVDVARAAAFGTGGGALPIALGGTSGIEGRISGPAAAPTITLQTNAPALVIGGVSGVEARTQLTYTADALVLDRATIRAEGGSAELTATLPLIEGRPQQAAAQWRDLQASTVLALAGQPPRPIAASLTGSLQAERDPSGVLTVKLANQARPGTGAVPLGGQLSLAMERGEYRLEQQHSVPGALSVSGDLSGRIEGADVATATVAGTLTTQVEDVSRAAQAAARLGVSVPEAVTDARGPVTASVTLDGRVDALAARAVVDSSALSLPGLGPAAVHAEIDATPARVDISTLTATIGSTTVSGQAAIDLNTRGLTGNVDLRSRNVADLLEGTANADLAEGPLTANIVLGGTLANPLVHASASAEGLVVQGQTIDTLTLDARLEGQLVTVESLRATQGEGEVSATATYRLTDGAYTANVSGGQLSWTGPLVGSTESTVRVTRLQYIGEGTVSRPGGEANISFEVTGGVAGTLVGDGTAVAQLTGDRAVITARVPALGALINANVATRAPYTYDATAVINEIDLAKLAPLAGAPEGSVAGQVSLSATASGTLSAPAESTAFVNLQEVTASVNEVPIALSAPARLAYQDSTVRVDGLDLQLGQGKLQASGELSRAGARKWDARFSGQLGDLVRMAQPFGAPAELVASGAITASWQSAGNLETSTAAVQLDGGTVSYGRAPPVSGLTLRAAFDGQRIEVPTLTGEWQGGGISGSASVPRALLDSSTLPTSSTARGFAKLQVVKLDAAAFEPWLDKATLARIQGQLSATVDAEIASPTVEGVTATLTLDEAAYLIAGIEVSQSRPSRIVVENGIVRLEDVAWTAGGSPLSFTGSVALVPADNRTLEVGVTGEVDLRIASAFLPDIVTDGTAAVDLRATGALASPNLTGRVQLADAGLAIRDPRIAVSEVSGPIVIENNAVIFDGIAGSVNGGTLALDGRLALDGMSVAGGALVAQLQQVALELPEGLQSEVSALVTLTPDEEDWVLGGDVRIERSAYTDPISLAAIAAARRTRPPVVAADEGPSALERLRLNLFVVTEEDLRVDNNYGRLEAGAAVRVVGTAAQPGLTGRVTLREGGEIFLAGNRFYIESGSISFVNPSRIEPEIDIQARAQVSGNDITLSISGPADRIVTEVSGRNSQGPLTEREARAVLFGGLVGDEQALTLLSAEVLGVTGRAIGLDSLRIERGFDSNELRADPTLIATETDPSARLTLSKRLRPEIEFIFSQSLRDSGDLSAIISYKPRPNIEIRAISRDNIDRSIAIRHEVTFGGQGNEGSAATQQPLITAVRIGGAPGRPDAAIRSDLRLQEGDRFDFFRLQRDIDDVRQDYHEEGYYEARVRARREPSEDGVAIDYTISQGPRTSLIFSGHELHPDLESELNGVWQRVVFDQFLIDEVESRVQRHLLSENYVGSVVDAAITTKTPEEKQLSVEVTQGAKVERREIRYAGNETLSRDELDAVVEAAQLGLEGWLNPPRLGDAIEGAYRERGFLAAEATTGEPTADGPLGVLTVLIEEGPRFTFSDTSVAGVSPARRDAAVATIGALAEGAPYDRDAVDRVAASLEEQYQRLGYNEARVETRSEVNASAGTIAIAFEVEEGAQQILRAVSTEGATRTRPGVINRALRLQPGQPVDLARWAQSRKRLYDTNVFREVDLEPVPMEATAEDIAAGVQPVRAVVRVVEYPAWRLRYGGQYRQEIEEQVDEESGPLLEERPSQGTGFGVLGDLQNRNLFGRAITGGLAVSYQPRRNATALFGSTGSFFGLPIRTNAFLSAVRERERPTELFQFIEDRLGATLEQRWRPFADAELTYSYRLEQAHIFELDPDPDQQGVPLDDRTTNASVSSALFIDRRNDPFNATAGWFSSANWDQAVQALGSTYSTKQALLQGFYYREFGRIVTASAVRYGVAFNVEAVDPRDRFLAGGATTVRGYAEDALGPRDFLGRPAGGAGLLILNQEVRFPIYKWAGGVGFIDAGNVFAERSELSFSNLELGYGFGLRLQTPFALLRVDYGIAGTAIPASRGTGLGKGRFYFGIGQVF